MTCHLCHVSLSNIYHNREDERAAWGEGRYVIGHWQDGDKRAEPRLFSGFISHMSFNELWISFYLSFFLWLADGPTATAPTMCHKRQRRGNSSQKYPVLGQMVCTVGGFLVFSVEGTWSLLVSCICYWLGYIVEKWLVILPYSIKVTGSIPGLCVQNHAGLDEGFFSRTWTYFSEEFWVWRHTPKPPPPWFGISSRSEITNQIQHVRSWGFRREHKRLRKHSAVATTSEDIKVFFFFFCSINIDMLRVWRMWGWGSDVRHSLVAEPPQP